MKADLPLVSCICPTFNRPPHHTHLLEEAIESFHRQDYPNKELIIVNDCPGHTLRYKAPDVKVMNFTKRFPSIGDKRNMGIWCSRGSLIALWDDDDISLPWRLSESVTRLGSNNYFNPIHYWYWERNTLHCDHTMGVGHNCSIFRRTAMEQVGNYQRRLMDDDLLMDQALRSLGSVSPPLAGLADLDRWFYIYRWGVSPAHGSANHDPNYYNDIGKRTIVPGHWQLNPHWRTDYVALTTAVCQARSGS